MYKMSSILSRCIFLFSFFVFATSGAANRDTVFTELPSCDYPVKADALPVFTCQYPLKSTLSIAPDVRIVYPEYKELTRDEVACVRRLGVDLPTEIVPRTEYGVSRKQALLDISFCPLVRKDNRYYRLVSCKISVNESATSPVALQRKQAQASGRAAAQRWAEQSVLASGKWVKIRVEEEGVYELTASKLAAMGFPDIDKVKVYGYGGRIVPEAWTFTGSGRTPDDLCEVALYRKSNSVLFFAEGTVRWTWNAAMGEWLHEQQPYSRYSYYFVTEGDSPKSWDVLSSSVQDAPEVSEVMHHALYEKDATAIYAGGRELYDSHDFSFGNSRSYKVATPDVVDGSEGVLYVSVAAANRADITPVDITLGGDAVGRFYIPKSGSNDIAYESRRSFKTRSLSEENAVGLEIYTSEETRLNAIRLTYLRTLNAASSPFSFSPSTQGPVKVILKNAGSGTRLWLLPDGEHDAAEIAGTLQGDNYVATVPDGNLRYAIVDVDRNYSMPVTAGNVPNQNLHADDFMDMIIVCPASGKLVSEAERLAEGHRQKDGLRVKVVTVDQLYNEFSSGTPDASAIRRYLKMFYDRAVKDEDMPRYLLLFGDCAWDNRMITSDWNSYSSADFLPAFEVSDRAVRPEERDITLGPLSSYVTDDFYSWLDDSEGISYSSNKPDVAVGRFPCIDPSTAKTFVDKSLAYLYNEVTGAWKNKIYVLGDDINNTLHMSGAENVASAISSVTADRTLVHRVYWDTYKRTYSATGYTYPQATRRLREEMKRGALIFNYIGHGSPDQISHAHILDGTDFALSSSGRLPLWIMASCEISPYDTRHNDLGRIALSNPSGGAIGVICASRLVFADYNEALNISLCRNLFPSPNSGTQCSIGEALRMAKSAMVTTGSDNSINKLKYLLLGDPALYLAAAGRKVTLDSINGHALASQDVHNLPAGSVVRFSGHVNAAESDEVDETFSGTLTATISDRMETVVCQNNSGDDKVMTYRERTKTVFEGSDSVRAGRFSISVAIPTDISYTDDRGRITFYAVNAEHSAEATGKNEQFTLNGTAEGLEPDTLASEVYVWLDNPDFPSGGLTSTSPLFVAEISDDRGISVSGLSLGRDMELVLDENYAEPVVLNDYFTYTFGDYRSGRVAYQMPELTTGTHSLSFRVWDAGGNYTLKKLRFTVSGEVPVGPAVFATQNPARTATDFVTHVPTASYGPCDVTIEVYDIQGHKVWTSTASTTSTYDVRPWNLTDMAGARLPAGIYLFRALIEGGEETDAKKIILLEQ